MFVRDWLARRAILSRHKLAITDLTTGAQLTYLQLDERATRLANYLRAAMDVQSGDRVAVLATNRAGILEAFFAAAKLTAVLVPLNYRLTASELGYILTDCQPKVLLYEQTFAEVVDELRGRNLINQTIVFEGDTATGVCYEQALANASMRPVEVAAFDPEMPAMIIYTSGTTGHPKGAVLSHRMLTWNSINTNLAWDIVSSDITTVHAPLFHTGGFNVLTLPLLHIGARVIVLPNFDAEQVLRTIEQHRCTIFFGVPTMFQLMLESPRFATTDFSSIRYFISGGAPCPVPLIQAFQQRGVSFVQGYGLTEVGPNCFKLGLEDAVRKAGSIGFPTFHSAARIVDCAGGAVAQGEVGELWLRGGHVCSGYWRNEEATAQALCAGWFHTGDLARQDEEGYYYIAGRAKDMIISGGENIYPAEVEAVLHAHPAVAAAALIGLPDAKWGEVPVAAVVKRADVTTTELVEFCATRLARYKLPKQIFFVAELPLSASGKVLKRTLKEHIETDLLSASS